MIIGIIIIRYRFKPRILMKLALRFALLATLALGLGLVFASGVAMADDAPAKPAAAAAAAVAVDDRNGADIVIVQQLTLEQNEKIQHLLKLSTHQSK